MPIICINKQIIVRYKTMLKFEIIKTFIKLIVKILNIFTNKYEYPKNIKVFKNKELP